MLSTMSTHDRTGRDQAAQAARTGASLFAVRLWKEELAGGAEYRGSVREVTSGAFRGFRDWSDLVAFMVARLENNSARPGAAEEAGDVGN
jgi:hypothetical protein